MNGFSTFNELTLFLRNEMKISAAIFDLDGTLIDNNHYHLLAWKRYLQEKQIEISEENYKKHINGRTNKDAIEWLYNRKMSEQEAVRYALEKEAIYRELYAPFIKPIKGLIEFLQALKDAGIKMAIATSGITVNIEFLFEHIPIRRYFDAVIHSGNIKIGKPDPEIYLIAASALKIAPEKCMAFEDAAVGVTSARDAGMKIVALTTTQTREELHNANYICRDFSLEALSAAFSPSAR